MKNGKLYRLSTPGTPPYLPPPPPKKKKKPWALLQSTFMTMVEIQQPNLALQYHKIALLTITQRSGECKAAGKEVQFQMHVKEMNNI